MAERTIVVTGGTRGIGAAITRAFANAGDRVLIASRTAPERVSDPGVRHVVCDARRPVDLERVMATAVDWTGRLDVLVNNAGMSAWRELGQIDEMFWADMIATNLTSVLFASKAAVPRMRPGSAIVNVSSLAGKRGSANNAAYCAAKFGVNGITQSLAKELGPLQIRVNAVCPVYVETAGLADALKAPQAPPKGADVDEYLREFARSQSALGRLPTADEIAAACVMLASPAAAAMTGQCVNVDCGVLPQ